MRAAGAVVADALGAVREAVAPGVTTAELDEIAAGVLRKAGAESSFMGYHGYPATICVSVNDEVVHGIPGDRTLAEGDIVSIDCGAIVSGWHGDAAISVIAGRPRAQADVDLVAVTAQALQAGIDAMQVGARVGDVSAAIEASVETHPFAYGIVEEFVGHGIGSSMHMPPDVPNYGKGGHGVELVPGIALALEPMITLGSGRTTIDPDGWTARTDDGSRCAHVEHTVAVTAAGPWVLTLPTP